MSQTPLFHANGRNDRMKRTTRQQNRRQEENSCRDFDYSRQDARLAAIADETRANTSERIPAEHQMSDSRASASRRYADKPRNDHRNTSGHMHSHARKRTSGFTDSAASISSTASNVVSSFFATAFRRRLTLVVLAMTVAFSIIALANENGSIEDITDEIADDAGVALASTSAPASASDLDVTWIDQEPDLPTGCEITAATMMLDYYGFSASNVDLNEYLAQTDTIDLHYENGTQYGPDPNEFFIGDTASESGWFCNTTPVVNALNEYLTSNNSTLQAVDLTGISTGELYQHVADGDPVTVWVTIAMKSRSVSDEWFTEDGELIQASTNDHAMTIIGYNSKTVTMADPLEGIVTYSRKAFERAFSTRGNMAVMLTQTAQTTQTA